MKKKTQLNAVFTKFRLDRKSKILYYEPRTSKCGSLILEIFHENKHDPV